jgi:RNA recognition motif-containing protein
MDREEIEQREDTEQVERQGKDEEGYEEERQEKGMEGENEGARSPEGATLERGEKEGRNGGIEESEGADENAARAEEDNERRIADGEKSDERERSESRSRSRSRSQSESRKKKRSENKTKFYVGRIHTDTREEDLRSAFDQFGEIYEVKIIKKSYNGQPLRDTYYAFVVIWLDKDAREVTDYFDKTYKERGWNVSLAKESARDDSPKRRKLQRRPFERDEYVESSRRTSDQQQLRHRHHRERSIDDSHPRQDRRMRDEGYEDDESPAPEVKPPPEPEKRIPCSSLSLRDPEAFARLLLLPPDYLQNVILQLANNNRQALVAHNIRVREIWIGNLPNEITERTLKNTFEIYGTVDNIEIFQKPNQIFAFLRYEKVSQASKAFENVDPLGLQLRANLKISFSDYLKRNSIVGDSLTVQDNKDEMVPYVFLCYSNGASLPKEGFVREKLAEYGQIISVLMRPSYNNNLKSFILVEYSTLEEALACRKGYNEDDEGGHKKLKLGDRKLEVNILIGSKVMRPFEANIVPSGMSSSMYSTSYMGMQTGRSPSSNQPVNSIAPSNPQPVSKFVNDDVRLIFDETFIQKKKERETLHEMKRIGPCFMEEGQELPEEDNSIMTRADIINELPLVKAPQDPNAPPDIENRYELFWSGFITKEKKNNVGVDGYLLSGDSKMAMEEIFTLGFHNLNLTHKTNVKEVLTKTPLAIILMIPSNPTQKARFQDEYRAYFKDKKIIGIVKHLRGKIIYLFPWYEELKELLGGINDGMYMVGMVAEMTKKEEPPKTEVVETPTAAPVVVAIPPIGPVEVEEIIEEDTSKKVEIVNELEEGAKVIPVDVIEDKMDAEDDEQVHVVNPPNVKPINPEDLLVEEGDEDRPNDS